MNIYNWRKNQYFHQIDQSILCRKIVRLFDLSFISSFHFPFESRKSMEIK